MIVLGIETATPACSVALVNHDGLIAETRLHIKNIHARKLPVMIRDLINAAVMQMNDISAIAVSNGPGSFTGLRIGLAAAKGLAMAGDIPLTAVPTLKALAAQAPVKSGKIAAVIRSRKDEYYLSVFERSILTLNIILDVCVLNTEQLLEQIPADACVIGQVDGLNVPGEIVPAALALPGAYSVAMLGLEQLKNEQTHSLEEIEPYYHQEFIAGKPKKIVL